MAVLDPPQLHPAVTERLARLAPDQRAAATAPAGPVLCVAPAGSGKTTTLVARIAWLVATGTPPSRVTAVTFNKRAADELGERLAAALLPLGVAGDDLPRVRTFHALGREILAEAGVNVSKLVDRAQALKALNGGRALRPADLRKLDDGFSRLKLDRQVDWAAVAGEVASATDPAERDVLERFIAYERWLAAHDSLDFDDLVRRSLALSRTDDRLAARWRERCSSLLVDEVQDVDRSQLELALALTGNRRDIFLVGDDDQTIYAWRLADVRRVLDLASSLPGLRRVDLVTNYRCPKPVVDRAVRLISVNTERFAKQIEAGPAAQGSLVLAADPGDELARARRLLTAWLPAREGVHAVLARTNGELAPFAAVALELGIAYRAAEDGLVLDDPAIDDLVGALPPSARPSLALVNPKHRLAPALLAWSIPYATVDALWAAITRAREQRSVLRRDDAELVLATAHGTKGLEFDHVAVIGLDENVFPSRRTLEDSDDPSRAMEEERRLAYVAWTRARRSLTLVYDPVAPSQFMRDAFSATELAIAA
jgi:superfamily I DNA/RNA helicase